MSAFSFSFSGDDIDNAQESYQPPSHAAETGTLARASSSAFPIAGQPQLQPQIHDLEAMLKKLPSKIAYSTLTIILDDGSCVSIPRRELWDVRVQLMAEDDDDENLNNLAKDDVKTGVYEGGFKSWESSVDVVKALHRRRGDISDRRRKIIELGCGTALPSLASFQWMLQKSSGASTDELRIGLADYNPTVLQLVTLPNIVLSWAYVRKETWEAEGELDLDQELIDSFLLSLQSFHITLSFFSGAWSPEFVRLVGEKMDSSTAQCTIIGAETIYSPFSLKSFAEALSGLLNLLPDCNKSSLVAAKMVYFGVGGSMEDFCNIVVDRGFLVEQIREESDGVRRLVVEVKPPSDKTWSE